MNLQVNITEVERFIKISWIFAPVITSSRQLDKKSGTCVFLIKSVSFIWLQFYFYKSKAGDEP